MAPKSPKKSKTMIWTEFLKSTCKPIKPDHPPAKPAQPTHPPEPINGQLADGLFVNLFSTDGQRICPIPDPNPPLRPHVWVRTQNAIRACTYCISFLGATWVSVPVEILILV
jgi:hypothetical protein